MGSCRPVAVTTPRPPPSFSQNKNICHLPEPDFSAHYIYVEGVEVEDGAVGGISLNKFSMLRYRKRIQIIKTCQRRMTVFVQNFIRLNFQITFDYFILINLRPFTVKFGGNWLL